jgi:GTPase SAR1 family protein
MPIVAARSSAATATKQKRRKKKQLQFLVLGAAGAGKTSLLRRFFHGQFTYRRAPTVGADFYVGKVPRCTSGAKDDIVTDTTTTNSVDHGMTTMTNPPIGDRRKAHMSDSSDKNDNEDDDVLVQIWDTPGKENFAMRPPRQVQTAVTMQDSFFDNADAIMLVYDMTSSTSFTRLLRWYADLIELFQRQQEMTNDNNNATTTGGGKINNKRPKPILLVANKLDLFEQATNPRHQQSKTRVSQRDVLGLRGDFYGNDFHYEYSVSNNPNNNNNNPQQQQQKPQNNNNNNNNGTKRQNQLGRHNNGEISSQYFLANRVDNWTSDYNYLESLITAEDGSHPDRELVLLWCLRNNVQLYEVSAATGDGVTAAFQALVALAAEQWKEDDKVDGNEERMTVPKSSNDNNGTTTTTSPRPYQRNKELDLRTLQYQPPKESAFLSCFPTCSLFRQCLPK